MTQIMPAIETKTFQKPAESNTANVSNTGIVESFKNVFAAFLTPVKGRNEANEANFKKLREKNGKEEQARTIEDALDEIESIVRRMGLDK